MSIQLHFNSAVVAVLSLAGSFLRAATQLSSEEITFPLFPEDSGTERREERLERVQYILRVFDAYTFVEERTAPVFFLYNSAWLR